ncbi:hypothetical protein B0H13DRAFT_1884679 [Mycena leptocephala]|nr:hypothetical protein B0H13DRAFT_1884679 [Mycena leptocephala]
MVREVEALVALRERTPARHNVPSLFGARLCVLVVLILGLLVGKHKSGGNGARAQRRQMRRLDPQVSTQRTTSCDTVWIRRCRVVQTSVGSISGTILQSLYSVLILPLRYSGACRHELEKQNKVGTDYAALVMQSLLTGKPFYADILDECGIHGSFKPRWMRFGSALWICQLSITGAGLPAHRIEGSPRTKAKEYFSSHRKVQRHHNPLASRMSVGCTALKQMFDLPQYHVCISRGTGRDKEMKGHIRRSHYGLPVKIIPAEYSRDSSTGQKTSQKARNFIPIVVLANPHRPQHGISQESPDSYTDLHRHLRGASHPSDSEPDPILAHSYERAEAENDLGAKADGGHALGLWEALSGVNRAWSV